MAVAVKNVPETTPQQALSRLAVGSLLGTLYVVASLALVCYAIPGLWGWTLADVLTRTAGAPVNAALLILVLVAVGLGLAIFGLRRVADAPQGLRAGICAGLVFLFLIGALTQWVGRIFENLVVQHQLFGESGPLVGLIVMAVVGLALMVGAGRLFFQPNFEKWLIRVEDLGWFTTAAYKRSQGQRVRRGTILAVLVLAGCGIFTLLAHHTLETGPKDWQIAIPFTGKMLTLLPDVRFTLPILLAALTLWVGYRLVNFPPFADFLIATEAELNKVSWTTRKRLVQDTVVVLTTILLVTIFLFCVDIGWVWILERPWIQVLQTGSDSDTAKEIDRQIEQLNEQLETARAEKNTEKENEISAAINRLQRKKESAGKDLDW